MKTAEFFLRHGKTATLVLALTGTLSGLMGCGTPGAPLPPSLDLPQPVADLSAVREGNRVTLHWTMPRRNTDKLLLKGNVAVHLCRRITSVCESVGNSFTLAPASAGSFTEILPEALASGAIRPVSYYVELENRTGRSAGLSNAASVLAGAPPAPVEGLQGEVRKEGVALSWNQGPEAGVRLERTLLTPPSAKPKARQNLLSAPAEPVQQNLFVEAFEARGHRALDSAVQSGESYRYRAQRIVRMTIQGKTLELASEFSAPVQVEVRRIFPPAIPAALAAVAAIGEQGVAIDLSWQPDTESDLAGYIVYRREGEESWQRLTEKPSIAPAFHDAAVQPGHRYTYAVSAIGQTGLESKKSDPATETVPEKN